MLCVCMYVCVYVCICMCVRVFVHVCGVLQNVGWFLCAAVTETVFMLTFKAQWATNGQLYLHKRNMHKKCRALKISKHAQQMYCFRNAGKHTCNPVPCTYIEVVHPQCLCVTLTHTHTLTQTHAHTLSHKHTHTHKHTHKHTHTHTNSHTNTRTHAKTHTHTHTRA